MNLLQPDSSWRQTSLRPLPSISHGIQQSTFYSLCSNTNLWPPLHNSALLLRVLLPWMTSISTCPFLGTIKPSDTQLATWLPSLLLGRYGCAQKKNVHFYSSRSHTLVMVSNSFSIYSSQKSKKDPSKTCFNQVTLLLSLPMAPRSLRVEAKVLTMVYVALCDLLLTWFPSLIIVLPSIPGLRSPSSPWFSYPRAFAYVVSLPALLLIHLPMGPYWKGLCWTLSTRGHCHDSLLP